MNNSTTDGEKEPLRNIICFFFFGFLVAYHEKLIAASSQDILSGTTVPTTAIIIAQAVASIPVRLFAPWLVARMSYASSLAIGVAAMIVPMIVLVLSPNVHVRIVAAGGVSTAYSWNILWHLAMVANFKHIGEVISAYETGKHAAALVGTLTYTGMTTWVRIAPRIVVAASIPLSLLFIVVYTLLDKSSLQDARKNNAVDRANTEYMAVATSPDAEDAPQDSVLVIVWKVFPYLTYFYISMVAIWMTVNAILTTIAFPCSAVTPRDTFQYYLLTFHLARFLGGSEYAVISRLCPRLETFVRVRKVWIICLLEVAHIVMFLFASWYRFLPNLGIALLFCVSHGFLNGCLLVYGSIEAGYQFDDPRGRSMAFSFCYCAISFGYLAAGVGGGFVEIFLRRHCQNDLHMGEFCITRFKTRALTGWTRSLA